MRKPKLREEAHRKLEDATDLLYDVVWNLRGVTDEEIEKYFWGYRYDDCIPKAILSLRDELESE